ncbi:MAG TPA: long-chain fatty acid--CoA ligase [Thermoanaerobaculia bacterium]|jgi:long-chain acyl-CoA synthetase|nr:long-chain fatty acid--CoA ligase [Thermoanaerobaculia bacterium]
MGSEPRTLCDIFVAAAACGKPNLQLSKVGGAWKPISAADFGFSVRALSLGLNGLGIQPGDRVAILSENRPEWAMADFAILCAGAWSVPIYPTLPAGQVAPLLADCGAKAIFVSTLEQLGKILTVRSRLPSLDHVVLIEGNPPREPGFTTFHEVVDRGRPTLEMSPGIFEQRAARVKPEDVATIIYTSGTTGEPKGAMLTHRNFVSNAVAGCEVVPFSFDAVALSFLPLSHVFERLTDYAYFHKGASIAYAESIDKLAANFLEVNPHCFAAVPRVYEKVHAKIIAKAEAGGLLKRRLFAWALGVARDRVPYMERGQALPGLLAARARVADALVFKKIRAALGSNFRFAVSGGAPLSRDLAEFFIGAGVQIYEGYGLTETSPIICLNGPGRWRLGTVGKPLTGIEVKIADDGEILTRGPHIMKGYFNKPEATAEAIDREGWFHTGDIGELHDGFLSITDRKKDLIVLAGGKKAAPQPIENELKKSPFIGLPIVIGDRQKFLGALIVPNFERLKQWAEAGKHEIAWNALDANHDVRRLYQAEIDAYNAGKPHHEQIRAFALLPADLTIEDGSITPTLKVKRRILESRYSSLIEAMYAAADKSHVA